MGRALHEPIPQIIRIWLLMKEFPGLTPESIWKMPYMLAEQLSHMSSIFNQVQSHQAKRKKS